MPYNAAMSQADVVARSTRGPVTRGWLKRDLEALGVRPGMVLMVHASLSQLGWVVGGAITATAALCDALGLPFHLDYAPGQMPPPAPEAGTLIMPTFSTDNGEPSNWRHPPVPESWWDTIRHEMPPYDPSTAPLRMMGRIAEYFMALPGVMRSSHPGISWTGFGAQAESVLDNHSLDMCLGEDTPSGRCYELGGYVLSLATVRTTVLHLAEYRAEYPAKTIGNYAAALRANGKRRWMKYQDVKGDDEDFEQLRQDFMKAHLPTENTWREGEVAYSTSRLFAIRPLIDFAVKWMEEHRK